MPKEPREAIKQEAIEWASRRGLAVDWRWWEPDDYFGEPSDSYWFVITDEGEFSHVMHPDTGSKAKRYIYLDLKEEFIELLARHGASYDVLTNVATSIWPKN